MSRFINISEYEDFFKSLKLSLKQFGIKFNVTPYQYFADKLFIKGENKSSMFSSLLNLNTGKDLKVRELLSLLDTLGEDGEPVLDYLCNRYGFVCSAKFVGDEHNEENIKDLLLKIGASNGRILNDYIDFNDDNYLDLKELKELLIKTDKTISLLTQFKLDLETKEKAIKDFL